MQYPCIKLVVPTPLKNVQNGKLPDDILAKINCGGRMWGFAAFAFNLMYDEAKAAGITLKNIGDYRPYENQMAMFRDRYDTVDHGRKVTRVVDGVTYYLKPGKSPSSAPGKSNHGLGLAIDLNVNDSKTLEWLCANAPAYGFYLQGSDPKSPEFEAWHWQYCVGDNPTPKVKAVLDAFFAGQK